MAENSESEAPDEQRTAALDSLERLVGEWQVGGAEDSRGIVRFEWFLGERGFLVQHVELADTHGTEFIGWDPDRRALASHYFGSDGQILEYTWQVTADTLTIFFGTEESPARYMGTFSDDGNTNSGGWKWPGGGYESTMTRVT